MKKLDPQNIDVGASPDHPEKVVSIFDEGNGEPTLMALPPLAALAYGQQMIERALRLLSGSVPVDTLSQANASIPIERKRSETLDS